MFSDDSRVTIPTTTGSKCDGSWTAPSLNYTVAWVYNEATSKVTFSLSAKLQTNQWMAIGFNSENRMVIMQI